MWYIDCKLVAYFSCDCDINLCQRFKILLQRQERCNRVQCHQPQKSTWKAKGKKKLISVIECVSVKYGREENNQCQCGSGQKHLLMAYLVVYRVLIKTLPHLTKL